MTRIRTCCQSQGVRPDGRSLNESRSISLNVGMKRDINILSYTYK